MHRNDQAKCTFVLHYNRNGLTGESSAAGLIACSNSASKHTKGAFRSTVFFVEQPSSRVHHHDGASTISRVKIERERNEIAASSTKRAPSRVVKI